MDGFVFWLWPAAFCCHLARAPRPRPHYASASPKTRTFSIPRLAAPYVGRSCSPLSATSCSTSTRNSNIVPQLALSHETSADGKEGHHQAAAWCGNSTMANRSMPKPRNYIAQPPSPRCRRSFPKPELAALDHSRRRRSPDHPNLC